MTITRRLPAPLSERLSAATDNIYNRQGREVDIALGGIPFRLAVAADTPLSIETIPVRKDQFDAENDPGEQSLTGWWRRSQSSFHEGAGSLYQEDSAQNIASASFYDSSGVDVWTPGEVKLLKLMKEVDNPTPQSRLRVSVRDVAGTTWLSFIEDGNLLRAEGVETGSTTGTVYDHATEAVVDGLLSGSYFYAVTDAGTFAEGTPVTGTPTTTTWPLTGGTPKRLEWGLHRPWVISDREIWQPDVTDVGGTAQAAIYTHPNKGFTYTCLAEVPQGMLFGGHDGRVSTVQIVTLDTAGGVPTLSGAIMACKLPDGELVQELSVIAGSLVGIGTNRGFRVGAVQDTRIAYGPLLFSPEGVTACTAIANFDRFFYVAFDADSTDVYRVDTSLELGDGVFPYARDVALGAGYVTSLVVADDGRVFATDSTGERWHQSATEYVSSGWLETGRIRFRTTEPKDFRYLQMEIHPLAGTLAVDFLQEGGGSALPIGTLSRQGEVFDQSLSISLPRMKHGALKFTFVPTGDALDSPVLNSYLLRALPATPPQRLITLPLQCYDKEQARSGQWYGGLGFGRDRLSAVHILEDLGEAITYQDFSESTTAGLLVVIESARFIQTAPAAPFKANGAGGLLILQLRTVDG